MGFASRQIHKPSPLPWIDYSRSWGSEKRSRYTRQRQIKGLSKVPMLTSTTNIAPVRALCRINFLVSLSPQLRRHNLVAPRSDL